MTPFSYIHDYYGVPAQIGRRVECYGELGIIAADRGHYIGVNLDKDAPGVVHNYHPTDGVKYLDMGEVRKVSKGRERMSEPFNFSGDYAMERMIERAVKNARPHCYGKSFRWVGVQDVFGWGSRTSAALCRHFGLDPMEEVEGCYPNEESDET